MAEIKIYLQNAGQNNNSEQPNEKMIYSGDTSCLTELGYHLDSPLPGQIIKYGMFEGAPLEWLTVSISRHSITLISLEEMCAEGDPEQYETGDESIDPEDAYWNDFADGLLASRFYDPASHNRSFDFHGVDGDGDISEGQRTSEFGYELCGCLCYLRPVIIRKNAW